MNQIESATLFRLIERVAEAIEESNRISAEALDLTKNVFTRATVMGPTPVDLRSIHVARPDYVRDSVPFESDET